MVPDSEESSPSLAEEQSDEHQATSDQRPLTFRGRRFGRWLFVEPWPFHLAVGGVGGCIALGSLFTGEPEAQVRWSGLLLQIFGLGTVAFGLHHTRKLFNQPSVWDRVREWITKLPTFFRPPRHQDLQAGLAGSSTDGAEATAVQTPAKDSTLEDRVEILEQELEALRSRHRKDLQQVTAKVNQLQQSQRDERRKRIQSYSALDERLESLAVGGLRLDTVGLTWLVVGVALATVPGEAASLLCGAVGAFCPAS